MIFGTVGILFFAFIVVSLNKYTAVQAHAAAQHEALHQQNIARAKHRAFAAHLKREAYDKAHPEEVARRKADELQRLARSQAAAKQQLAYDAEQKRISSAHAATVAAQANRERHACETAHDYERKAAHEQGDQASYDLSVSGLHYVDLCQDETDAKIMRGYLLSFKGLAEHELTSGDWRTDLNQANQLLVECQTTPGIYGTQRAAQCETQEGYNIKASVQWGL